MKTSKYRGEQSTRIMNNPRHEQQRQAWYCLLINLAVVVSGVCWDRHAWKAAIGVNGKVLNLGLYKEEADAARAYDKYDTQPFIDRPSPSASAQGLGCSCVWWQCGQDLPQEPHPELRRRRAQRAAHGQRADFAVQR